MADNDRWDPGMSMGSVQAPTDVVPNAREVVRNARELAIRKPSFTGLQTRIRRERLMPVQPLVDQILAIEDWPNTFLDETQEPDPGRLRVRRLVEEAEPDDDLVSMGSIRISHDGRSLRTFTGKKASEVAIMNCPKSHRMLHVEGATAESFVISQQVAHATTAIVTEGMSVRWAGGRHDPDIILYRESGGIAVREIKRDENDLRDARLRRNIAVASEILRRAGIGYSVVFRREIFQSIRHRRNAHIFASRGFAHVSRRQLDAFDNRIAGHGPMATWGELVSLLDRRDRIGAVASAQALVIRRRVEIDLAQRVRDDLPITLHPTTAIH